MSRSWWFRFVLLVFFLGTGFVHVFPTVANLNLETTKFPFKKKVNLGLDLQGGLYMVYGVDFQKVYKEVLERLVDGLKGEVEKNQGSVQLSAANLEIPEDPKLDFKFSGITSEALRETLKKQYANSLRIVDEKPGVLTLAIGRDYRGSLKENTLNQSLQVIRNRIDEFGVSEPTITTKGDNQVVVELPGVKEVERAKQLVGRTARLEFKMVNDEAMPMPQLLALVTQVEKEKGIVYKEGEKYADYLDKLNAELKGKIPENSQVVFEREAGKNIPYLLFSKIELTGNELQDAFVSFDQQNQSPIVSFQLNPRGAGVFEAVTGANIGHRLAIVLDDVIHSAPVIQGKIPGGHGQITLGRAGGDQAFKEAKDLAIVLRAGALPARLELLEQRVIGPSLGADSIRHGITAGLVGCALVFIFMLGYYRMSGAVAVVSLLFNLMFTFAILIGIDATLTLPGIAGLALTIGMAVDSNVIIFERIRDELLEGKAAVAAIQAGFDKAFSCIFDANITHGIVAIILLNFGSGPIKGFAITLLIGIATTLFCAVTVCKLFFDAYIHMKNRKIDHLSI